MLRTLFFNSVVSALQITVGLAIYFPNGSVWSAALTVAIMTAMLFFLTTDESERSILITASCAAFSVAAIAGIVVLVANATEPSFGRIAAIILLVVFAVGCIIAIAVWAFFMVNESIKDSARESRSLLIIVRIPAGIGTVVGSTVLLTQWLHGLVMGDKYPMA